MREEHPSSEEHMGFVPCEFLKARQESGVYSPRPKLVYEFVVINRVLFSIRGHRSFHDPGGNNLGL
jgi:hypothetical protein